MKKIDIRLLMRKQDEVLADKQEIIQAVIDAGREYTPEERKRMTVLDRTCDSYAEQIRDAQNLENERAGIPAGQPKPTAYGNGTDDPLPGLSTTLGNLVPKVVLEPPAPSLLDVKTGRNVRCFLPGQDWRQGREYQLPDGIRPEELRISNIVRGVLSGDWSGREMEKRVMSEETGMLGGFTIPSPLAASILQEARNALRVIQAGAITVEMTAPTLTLAKITKEPEAYWIPEHGAGTFSDMNFGFAELKAKKVQAMTKMSEEVVMDSANIETLLREAMAFAIAKQIDRATLLGSGTGEPLGILNTDGIGSTDLSSAAYSIDNFIDAIFALVGLNVEQARICLLCNADVMKGISKLKASTAGTYLEDGAPEAWKKLRKLVTAQVPTDTGTDTTNAYLGDFRNLYLGMRNQLMVLISREASDNAGNSAFQQGEIWFRVESRMDLLAVRPAAFHVLKDGGVS